MAYCTSCGAALPENVRFCGKCGAPAAKVVQPKPQAPSPEEVTSTVFGRILAGLSLGNGIVGFLFSFSFAMLAAGVISTQPSMPIVALFFTQISILSLVFAKLAKNKGCTNKMARTGVIMGLISLALYSISIPVLFIRL